MRLGAVLIGLGALAYTTISPEDDTNVTLLWLCLIIALRGLYKSLKVLTRVAEERQRAKHSGDEKLQLLAGENVRRHLSQVAKLLAFIFIIMMPLSGYANLTVSRVLILVILLLISGGAELDDDDITDFDEMRRQQREESTTARAV